MILTNTNGQTDLPRYFARVFDQIKHLNKGRVDVILPDGRHFRAEGPEPGHVAEVHVHNDDLFARTVREGDMGFSEAYLDGWWTTPDLMAVMDFMHDDADHIYDGFPAQKLIRAYERLRFWMQRNSKTQARKNISYHYDLGNDFYGLWLDDTMTYSSALFDAPNMPLAQAQQKKYASMCDLIGVQEGQHVLEIGCGWGGFAEYAAGVRGAKVTGLAISKEQLDYAQQRMVKAGLNEKVELVMRDYRDETRAFDGVASIEMFEAVGEKYWPVYFQRLHDRLVPGAQATLQIITVHDRLFEGYRRSVDFIQKYIYPGGMLPSPPALAQQIQKAGLSTVGYNE